MLPPPASPTVAGIAGLGVALAMLALGYGVAHFLVGARPWGRIVRLGLALPGLMVFTLVMMLVHIVSGGALFSSAALTRAVIVVAGLLLVVRAIRRSRRRRADGHQRATRTPRIELVALGAVVLAAVLLWGYPATQLLPIDQISDSAKHAAWATELMVGETTPSAPITGQVPNYYPWLYHALLAAQAHLVPGGRALHALTPMFFVQVLGAVLSLFALGRELTRRWYGGVAAALFGGLAGGFGYLLSGGPAIVFNPRADQGAAALRYLGDMVYVRSYSMSFNNLAPAFPRDLGFALLPACILLMLVGLTRRSLAALVGAGVTIGLIGLTSGESTLFGLCVAGLVSLMAIGIGRLRSAAAMILPALVIWGLWVVPLFLNYSRYEGFRDMINTPVRLTPVALLGCWGMATPFALWGLVRWGPKVRSEPGPRILLATLFAGVVLVVGSLLVPVVLGSGFTTLSRQHRYWPLVYLSIALYAAVGASEIIDALARRGRKAVVAVAAALTVALSVPSPALAGIAVVRDEPRNRSLTSSLLGRSDSMLEVMTPRPGVSCVAAVPPSWTRPVWSFTGYRLVLFRWWKRIDAGASHIRWQGIYRFIPSVRERLRVLRVLLSARDRRAWERAVERWRVDVIVIPRAHVPGWLRHDHRVVPTVYEERPATVVWTSTCAEK